MSLGEIWLKVPESVKIVFHGRLQPWVGGKDLILHAIGQLGVDGARYQALEFTGEVVDGLDMAGRFSMANMAIEAGAKTGIIAADETTQRFVAAAGGRTDRAYASDPDADWRSRRGTGPVAAVPRWVFGGEA